MQKGTGLKHKTLNSHVFSTVKSIRQTSKASANADIKLHNNKVDLLLGAFAAKTALSHEIHYSVIHYTLILDIIRAQQIKHFTTL